MADDAATVERLRAELRQLQARYDEAQEQQAALADVLQRMVVAPGDAEAVLAAIAEHATRLGRAIDTQMYRRNGDLVYLAAHAGPLLTPDQVNMPWSLGERRFSNEVIRGGRTIHEPDIGAVVTARYPDTLANAQRVGRPLGHFAWLGVPLHLSGEVIGALTLRRSDVAPFSDREIAVVEAFAAEAALAIENARLFQELEQRNAELQESNRQVTEALEQQTATAEVLRVIASSPTDLQAVLNTLTGTAARLCGAEHAVVQVPDGDVLRVVANVFTTEDEARRWADINAKRRADGVPQPPITLVPERIAGRAALERRTIYVANLADATEFEFPASREVFEGRGVQSQVTAPLLRGDALLGVFTLHSLRTDAFSPSQVAQLETFADQAVIAIENARLFEELERRNAELSEALEQQTATADVLRVIATSPADLRAVTDAVAANAARLCESDYVAVQRLDGEVFSVISVHGPALGPPIVAADDSTVSGRSVIERRTIHVHDVSGASILTNPIARDFALRSGVRTILATPILGKDAPIGAIVVFRREVRPFTDRQIALLETFADQAGIAIENARLFEELERRNSELSEALEQQTAMSDILGVIASSPANLEAVLQRVAESAVRLCDATYATIYQEAEDSLVPAAWHGAFAPMPEHARLGLPIGRGWVTGRAFLDRRTIHVTDLAAAADEFPDVQPLQRVVGQRAVLSTPLLRQGVPIGAINLARMETRPFTESQIKLIETFADQAVIAIENARLFEELEQRNAQLQESNRQVSEALEQQTAMAEVLRVIASSPTETRAVLDALLTSVSRLCAADMASTGRLDGDEIVFIAALPPEHVGSRQPFAGTATGRALQERRTVALHGSAEEQLAQYPESRGARAGYGAQVNTPLLREGQPIGTLNLSRWAARPFTHQEIALLETFADQAVIAIENARLFEELQEANRQLAEASRHK